MTLKSVKKVVPENGWNILSPSAVFLVALFLRRKINAFYHYQRMREVDFVLETAFTAFSGQFGLLDPPFEDIERKIKEIKTERERAHAG